jgi:hypothetical protein
MKLKMDHNLWIATALNAAPVSLILLVTECHVRIPQMLDQIAEYLVKFKDHLPLLCVCVTKMDMQREWTSQEFREELEEEYGVTKVIFSGRQHSRATVLQHIERECVPNPVNLTIDHKNFLRYFDIRGRDFRVLGFIREQKAKFMTAMDKVKMALEDPQFNESRKRDLIFSFQDFMLNQIATASVELMNTFNFSLDSTSGDPKTATEFGFVAALTNELKAILFDIRVIAYGLQNDHGVDSLRKCPHCHAVWTKVSGCSGGTICGNKLQSHDVARDYFSFAFSFRRSDTDRWEFDIESKDTSHLQQSTISADHGAGCGRRINWSSMESVPIPREFSTDPSNVTVNEIDPLRGEAARRFETFYRNALDGLGAA